MNLYKFLFFSFLCCSATPFFGEVDAQGWAQVEHPKKAPFEEKVEEEDPSIWVVFAKQIGSENFLVRFPEDPSYVYLPNEGIELFCSQEGRLHRLVVEPKKEGDQLEQRKKAIEMRPGVLLIEENTPSPNVLDLFYQEQGKWVWEHLVQSTDHVYFLQTKSESPLGEPHRFFADSFDVETELTR